MKQAPTPQRKLRTPGALFLPAMGGRGMPAEGEGQRVQPLPPCVPARTRFILRVMAVLACLFFAGLLVAEVRYYYSGIAMTLLHAFQVALFVNPAFGLLCIPARTARGSLFQLFCLPVPVLMTLCSCGWCWGTPDYDTTLGYGMAIVWVSMLGVLYVYLPLWVLHLVLFYVDKCRSK